jgi:hypothetical protein
MSVLALGRRSGRRETYPAHEYRARLAASESRWVVKVTPVVKLHELPSCSHQT